MLWRWEYDLASPPYAAAPWLNELARKGWQPVAWNQHGDVVLRRRTLPAWLESLLDRVLLGPA